jgi:hypothetical protein
MIKFTSMNINQYCFLTTTTANHHLTDQLDLPKTAEMKHGGSMPGANRYVKLVRMLKGF